MKTLFQLRQLPRLAASALLGLAALGVVLGASAQITVQQNPSLPAANGHSIEQVAMDWLQPALDASLGREGAQVLRPEVILGSLDPRLKLAPCGRVEPYLPPGTRLWGRSRVGLRCLEGAVRWNVFLPVTVKAWGPAWVLVRPVTAGTPLAQEDAEIAEIDWAEQHASVLGTPELWVGHQAVYALRPGQALRQHMVRPVPAFGPGEQVRVTTSGGGLHVVVTGQSLGTGVPGQSVRVRLAGGKVVTGTVQEDQTVLISL
ncbi:MAG: flagellar basal body P-ring formation chaperone FlgA [Hydrogenophaga sp.]